MTERSAIQTAIGLWHTQRIKRLIREHVGSGAACLVSIRETVCTDPTCAGPATEVRITSQSFRETRFTIHKPVSAVSHSDIAEMF
ncbi:hypothetical protein [Roseovarius amoyensis]|uniref:hypothetical protein n=1 Tax=Roseovarius amoyensis TaxID=2211448 RepID=UPI0013A6EEB8|nr:hypothetical protein [Roseovarius amoyensis]